MDGTGMLCGEVRFQHRASNQLLATLPLVFIVPNDSSCKWLQPLVHLMVEESLHSATASNVIIDRLSELLFMYALRHYVMSADERKEQLGIFALYAHPKLAAAITAIHNQPYANWTLTSLDKSASQSRTQFAKSIREVSGTTPMEYLAWWRMQLAWLYLSEGDPVFAVAEKVGYKSESSFLRAFKKTFQINAGQVRWGKRVGPGVACYLTRNAKR